MIKTKKSNAALVLVGGCFDVLHVGHINFLKKARSLGKKLVVMLEPDQKVRLLKGVNRPINSQSIRKKILYSLKYVDQVVDLPFLTTDEEYKSIVIKIKPNIIAVTKGDPIVDKKMAHAFLVGAKLVVIPKTKNVSTSEIAKKLLA